MTTAPAISATVLERALEDFRRVVGADHVLTAEEQTAEFRDPFWHRDWHDYEAAAVVQPASVEEIQAIVRHRERAPRPVVDDLGRGATTATAAPPRGSAARSS